MKWSIRKSPIACAGRAWVAPTQRGATPAACGQSEATAVISQCWTETDHRQFIKTGAASRGAPHRAAPAAPTPILHSPLLSCSCTPCCLARSHGAITAAGATGAWPGECAKSPLPSPRALPPRAPPGPPSPATAPPGRPLPQSPQPTPAGSPAAAGQGGRAWCSKQVRHASAARFSSALQA